MDFMTVKLVSGRRVRMPELGNTVMGGREYRVPKNGFWLKKLAEGDVVIASKPEIKPEKKGADK